MEETYCMVAVPSKLSNSIFYNRSLKSCTSLMNFKLMPDLSSFLPHSETIAAKSVDSDNEDCTFGDSESQISSIVFLDSEENRSGVSSMLAMTSEDESNWLATDIVRESEEDGSSPLEGDTVLDNSCSLSVVSDTISLCGYDLLGFETNSEIGTYFLEVEKSICDVELISKTKNLGDPSVGTVISDSLYVAVGVGEEIVDGAKSRSSANVIQLDKGSIERASHSIFEVNYVSLWGFTSVCGGRREMENVVATIPHFMKILLQMLIGDRLFDGVISHMSHLMGHCFGVYDGHRGSQVADYFQDCIHYALAEELEIIIANLNDGNSKDDCEELWRRVLTKCFLKVDDEIGGKASLETIGSNAVHVVIICSLHIIMANCGDSRAVLCSGKKPMHYPWIIN